MNNRFIPTRTYPDYPGSTGYGRRAERIFDILFAAGWWYFLTELGHILIVAVRDGCYCDFSQPEIPCSGIYMLLFEIAVVAAVSLPLFFYFCRGMFVEKVGPGKKAVILLISAALALFLPYLMQFLEAVFATLMPDIAAIEFAPWADADIMRFVRMKY